MKDALSALTQPLVTRPAYGGQGQGQSPVAESGLPSAGPGGMPMPIHPGIPVPARAPGNKQSQSPVAESGLPSGDGGGKGMSLDKSIPGQQTFNKPEDDIRDFDHSKEPNTTDPWRRDSPDDQLKERNVVDDNEDNADKHDGIGEMGKGEWDTTIKTKYPYRDGLPHQHYASDVEIEPEFIAGLWVLRTAHELRIVPPNRVVVATRPEEILNGLNPKFEQRARQCVVALKRVDVGNLRWIFSVDCGNGPKVVKMKAFRAKNIRALTKMDVDLSCSCPAWRWLGPEHHAQREEYLDGRPRGTASSPVVRDPTGVNRVCKHVAAVLSFAKGWEVPAARKGKG